MRPALQRACDVSRHGRAKKAIGYLIPRYLSRKLIPRFWEPGTEHIWAPRRTPKRELDSIGLAATALTLVIFVVALYEGVAITRIIGKVPRFWLFFLAAISFLIVRRLLILGAAALSISEPAYWSTLDSDGTPLIFSALLLLWVYDMRKSFQHSPVSRQPVLVPPEKPEPLGAGRLVSRDEVDDPSAVADREPDLGKRNQ